MSDIRESTKSYLDALAEAFCATPLPADVCADPCATIPDHPHPRYGTNLLTVTQAKAMLAQMLARITPPTSGDSSVERLREAACKTCGGRRSVTYAESTCQPSHRGPCPSCAGMPIAALSPAVSSGVGEVPAIPAGKPYLSDRFEWAAPGDQQEDAWIVRFCDQDVRDMLFTGPEAEAEARAAWERHAPGYNMYLFRLARLCAAPAYMSHSAATDQAQCPSSPDGRHQVDTSMESGPNNCFHCDAPMAGDK